MARYRQQKCRKHERPKLPIGQKIREGVVEMWWEPEKTHYKGTTEMIQEDETTDDETDKLLATIAQELANKKCDQNIM